MKTVVLLLAMAVPVWAVDPPKPVEIVLLNPVLPPAPPPLPPAPQPDPGRISLNETLYYAAVAGDQPYAGKIGWKVVGQGAIWLKAKKPMTVSMASADRLSLQPVDVPVGTLVIQGTAKGSVTITALGIDAAGDPAELRTITLVVDGGAGPDPTPGPGPNPKPSPVVVDGPKSITLIEDTTSPYPLRAKYWEDPDLLAKLKAKGSTVHKADVNAPAPAPDMVPYMQRAAGRKLPQVFIVVPSGPKAGTLLFEGPLPATPADLSKLLDTIGG